MFSRCQSLDRCPARGPGQAPCWYRATAAAEEKAVPAAGDAKIEVVFCLDTTGSMGGLIEGGQGRRSGPSATRSPAASRRPT